VFDRCFLQGDEGEDYGLYIKGRDGEKSCRTERERRERKRDKERQRGGDGRDNEGGNWREKMTVMHGIVYPSSRTAVSGIESCALILIMHTVDCWDDMGGRNWMEKMTIRCRIVYPSLEISSRK
jgi:hypothetical protein